MSAGEASCDICDLKEDNRHTYFKNSILESWPIKSENPCSKVWTNMLYFLSCFGIKLQTCRQIPKNNMRFDLFTFYFKKVIALTAYFIFLSCTSFEFYKKGYLVHTI